MAALAAMAATAAIVSRASFVRPAPFVLAACTVAVPFAQERPDTASVIELPPASSGGVRGAAPPDADVHRIEGAALRRFATLEDALAALPGFQARRAGGLGGYSELSFRGASGARVDVYLDGIRLNQDGDAAPDLSKWPALWFTALEARTGIDPAGSGPGAMARIDLSTRPATRAEAHARAASFGTGEAAVAARLPAGPRWNLVVGAQLQSADNDYAYFSDNGTLYNTEDDGTRVLGNNAYASRGARLTARRDGTAVTHSVSALWLESRKEYPGLFPTTARAYTTRSDLLAGWRVVDAKGPAAAWEAGLQGRRASDSYRDPGRTLGHRSHEQARLAWSGEADAAFRVWNSAAFAVRTDARLRAESVDPVRTPFSSDMASPAAQRREAQAGLWVDAVLRDGPMPVLAILEIRAAGIRFEADGVRSFPDAPVDEPARRTFAPVALRSSARWTTPLGTLGAVARHEPRAPTSSELLGDNHGVLHNPDLRSETARSLALTYAVGDASRSLRAVAFRNDYVDPIRLAAHGGSPFLRSENGPAYRASGLELAAAARARNLEASTALTLQDAEIREGLYAGNRPAWQSAVQAHAQLHWLPLDGARAGPVLAYRGPYFPGDANLAVARRDAEWDWGAHASYSRGPVRAALDLRNLTDRTTRDFAHSPRSGRSWAFTLSLNL